MYSRIFQEANARKEELKAWRHALHRIPELGLTLPRTCAFVREKLDEFQIPYETKVNGNCVAGYLGQGEHCLLLRADMDGLPVKEETGLDFASQNENMHACGHDMHTAALLGAAKLLKDHEKDLKCRIKLLFQPGEEIFAGAKAAIEEGILEDPRVDAAFGTHVASSLPVGMIGYGTGTNAAVYGFKVTFTGKGTHGAMPHNGVDPISAGVHLYLALQGLIARECDPGKEAVLTIGQFHAGNTANVIPEQAVLQGTLRVFDEETRKFMIKRIKEVVQSVAETFRTKAEIEELSNVPALFCDPVLNEHFADVFREMDPDLGILADIHTMASEDFAFISRQVPSSYFMIGARSEEREKIYEHHNPKVCFDDAALPVEAAAYACAALGWQPGK